MDSKEMGTYSLPEKEFKRILLKKLSEPLNRIRKTMHEHVVMWKTGFLHNVNVNVSANLTNFSESMGNKFRISPGLTPMA